MTLVDTSISSFLQALRSPAPTPGGGSASALAGAAGASLLTMVAGLPKPRGSTDADLQRLRDAADRCAACAVRLEALIERDAAAYDTVMAAYRLPRSSDEEKAARSDRIQAALKGAIETPLEMMRACAAALEEAAAVRDFGNANASSDVGVAVELLQAGLRGARLNVEINLEHVKDAAYVAAVRSELAAIADQ
jgi:methenyltetrahydrofolate cyclohydrolase